MKLKFKYSLKEIASVVFLLPFLMEATMIPNLLIQIPGFPLSAGRLSLIGLGLVGLNLDYKSIMSSRVYWAFIILMIGLLFGSLFSSVVSSELVTFVGFSLLIYFSLVSSSVLRFTLTQRALDVFFIVSYLYWSFYVLSISFGSGSFRSYGTYYRANRLSDESLINYHSFGLLLSCAVLYLTFRFFIKKRISLGYIAFLVCSVSILLITESRANVLITLFVSGIFVFSYFGLSFRLFLRGSVLVFVLGTITNLVIESDEKISRRFDVGDTEYIESSTRSRFEFVGLSFAELIKEPFGKGVSNNKVLYRGTMFQPHNQYLSFLLSAGFIGLLSMILWLLSVYRLSSLVFFKRRVRYFPYLSMSWVMMITLLTNDVSGAFFFLILMIQVWTDFSSVELRRSIKSNDVGQRKPLYA